MLTYTDEHKDSTSSRTRATTSSWTLRNSRKRTSCGASGRRCTRIVCQDANPSTAICRPWATTPSAPTPRSPSNGQLVIYRTSGTTSLATPWIFGPVRHMQDWWRSCRAGCVRIKNSGPGSL